MSPETSTTPLGRRRGATPTFLEAYGRMLLIREFEQAIHRLFLRGEVHGTTHLSAGQEAVPVGVCMALEPDDYVSGTYRGHGHALAKGTDPAALAAEMLGRATGVCGGRAGSMNVVDLAHGLVGCFGIVGGSIAAATGAALSAQRQGRVSVAFFGDGATNQAYFHECLNFAAVLSLPAVFVCENNFYGEFTPMQAVTGGGAIAARAGAYGIPFEVVEGNDVWAVREAAAARRARADRRRPDVARVPDLPSFRPLEVRPGAVPARGRARPLEAARPADGDQAAARRAGGRRGRLAAVEREVEQRIEAATEEALAAPYPDPRSAGHGVRRWLRSSSSGPRSATRSPRSSSATRR